MNKLNLREFCILFNKEGDEYDIKFAEIINDEVQEVRGDLDVLNILHTLKEDVREKIKEEFKNKAHQVSCK